MDWLGNTKNDRKRFGCELGKGDVQHLGPKTSAIQLNPARFRSPEQCCHTSVLKLAKTDEKELRDGKK